MTTSNCPFKSRSANSCPMRCASSGVTSPSANSVPDGILLHRPSYGISFSLPAYLHTHFHWYIRWYLRRPPVPSWSDSWHNRWQPPESPLSVWFFFIFHIFDRTVQAVDGDNTCISHPALPLFLYQMPCFFGKPQHFLNTLLACHTRSIGNMCKLIGIVA